MVDRQEVMNLSSKSLKYDINQKFNLVKIGSLQLKNYICKVFTFCHQKRYTQ